MTSTKVDNRPWSEVFTFLLFLIRVEEKHEFEASSVEKKKKSFLLVVSLSLKPIWLQLIRKSRRRPCRRWRRSVTTCRSDTSTTMTATRRLAASSTAATSATWRSLASVTPCDEAASLTPTDRNGARNILQQSTSLSWLTTTKTWMTPASNCCLTVGWWACREPAVAGPGGWQRLLGPRLLGDSRGPARASQTIFYNF